MAVKTLEAKSNDVYLVLVDAFESVELQVVDQYGANITTLCTVREGSKGLYLDLNSYIHGDVAQLSPDGTIHTDVSVPF